MANIIRSAKSSNDWDDNELIAYNIAITTIPSQQFFPEGTVVPLAAAGLDPAVATADSDLLSDTDVSNSTYGFFRYLYLATTPTTPDKPIRVPMIDAFAHRILNTVAFDKGRRCVSQAHSIPLLMSDDNRQVAQMSLCLIDGESDMLLLLQMNKTETSGSNVEARMVIGAIATYQFNNSKRREMGLHPLDAMTMPCITMIGTRPTFYLVPVTKMLSDAVISCQYPSDRTEVLKCEVASDYDGGMEAPEYRSVALQYYVAFKSLAKSHWEKFLPC
ncbi:hypothetical protein BDR04DRAFT_1157349 [Suillus decipiens]|nr:hypothetical protein BDR04DRAFT_1157349 [Suillus decipiens]